MHADEHPRCWDRDALGLWPYTDARLPPLLTCGRNDSVAALDRRKSCLRVHSHAFLCVQPFGTGQRASAMPPPPRGALRQSMHDGHSRVGATTRSVSHYPNLHSMSCSDASVPAPCSPPLQLFAAMQMHRWPSASPGIGGRLEEYGLRLCDPLHYPRLAPQTAILRIQYAWCSWKRDSERPEDTSHQWKQISTVHLDPLRTPN